MKVLAIGGSGGMGRYAVATMQDFDTVERIVVADRNAESAGGFVAQLNDKVSAIGLDVSDTTAMREAMTDADLVVTRRGLSIVLACRYCKRQFIQIAITSTFVMIGHRHLRCWNWMHQPKPVYAPLSGWASPGILICWR